MKKIFLRFFLVLAVLVLSSITASAEIKPPPQTSKFQITSSNSQQNSPAIYGDKVVYSDWGSQEIDIRLYNIKTKNDELLVSKPGHTLSADIYGNTLVYSDDDGSQSDIYGINVKTRKTFPIAVLAGSNQTSPAIFGKIVVWSDNRNGTYNIYGYNLRTKQEFQITNDSTNNYSPRIWKDKVVWYSGVGGLYNIKGYDISKHRDFNISSINNGHQQTPDIFNNQVVWIDSRSGSAEVYYKNLTNGEEKALTDTGGKSWPKISNKYITWVDDGGIGAHDIFVFNLAKGTSVQVSNDGAQQASPTIPDIWGNTVVWMSWVTGNGDIYGADIKK